MEINWQEFKAYLEAKYRKKTARTMFCYARKYWQLSENLAMLDLLGKHRALHTLKSLVALAKFSGSYEELKAKIKSCGIKWQKQSSLAAFMRIMNNSNSDILEWFKQALSVLDKNSRTFLEFDLKTGLRANEALEAFNLIIRLQQEKRLSEYFNEIQSTLEHFKYPKAFLRNTKNAFISIVPKELIDRIVQCKPITYNSIKMKLQRKHLPLRMDELRDFYATWLVQHDLIKEEADLLEGRISESIFIRHYFSPNFKELKERVLKAVELIHTRFLQSQTWDSPTSLKALT